MLLNCGIGEDCWESLSCKENQPVNLKGSQSRIFIGRTDAEDETPVLWPPDAKNWLIWKDPDAVEDWRREKKEMTEDKMVGWHHWLDGLELHSGSWRWTGKPGMLQSMGSQRVGQDWATEPNWFRSNLTLTQPCTVLFPSCKRTYSVHPKIKVTYTHTLASFFPFPFPNL